MKKTTLLLVALSSDLFVYITDNIQNQLNNLDEVKKESSDDFDHREGINNTKDEINDFSTFLKNQSLKNT